MLDKLMHHLRYDYPDVSGLARSNVVSRLRLLNRGTDLEVDYLSKLEKMERLRGLAKGVQTSTY